MGDFVDRGFYSVETFLLLLALKVRVTFGKLLVYYHEICNYFLNTIHKGMEYLIIITHLLVLLKML